LGDRKEIGEIRIKMKMKEAEDGRLWAG